jgi:hypothetical protein
MTGDALLRVLATLANPHRNSPAYCLGERLPRWAGPIAKC